MTPRKSWEIDYEWYLEGEYAVRTLIRNGGDYDILSRVEDYLYEEKVSSLPWPPQVLPIAVHSQSRG